MTKFSPFSAISRLGQKLPKSVVSIAKRVRSLYSMTCTTFVGGILAEAAVEVPTLVAYAALLKITGRELFNPMPILASDGAFLFGAGFGLATYLMIPDKEIKAAKEVKKILGSASEILVGGVTTGLGIKTHSPALITTGIAMVGFAAPSLYKDFKKSTPNAPEPAKTTTQPPELKR